MKEFAYMSFRVDSKRIVLSVIFTLMLLLSAGQGIASRQTAVARPLQEDTGPAGGESFGSAPTGDSSMGAVPPEESLGAAPNKSGPKGPSSPSPAPSPPKKTTSSTPVKKTTHKKQKLSAATTTKVTTLSEPTAAAGEEAVTVYPDQPAQVQPASTAAPLPTTGPEQTFGLFAGTGLAGFVAHKLYLRRKQ
jgi:hypothetical protein